MTAVALSRGAHLVIDHLEGSEVHSRGVCLSVEHRQAEAAAGGFHLVEVCAVIPADRLPAVIDALHLHLVQLQQATPA
jgi:hypothetical protein